MVLLLSTAALPFVALGFTEARSARWALLLSTALACGIVGFTKLFWRWGSIFAMACGVLAGFAATVLAYALALFLFAIGMSHH